MTRGRVVGAIVALVIVGTIIGAVYLNAKRGVPQVTTAPVEKGNLGVTVSASGDVEADESADVYPPTQATIADLRVHDGQTVKAGKVLAVLDKEQLEQQLDQAQAAYRQAVAQVDQVQNQAPTSGDRSAAAASVTAAAKAYQNATAALNEARKAYREATATIVRDAARTALRQAEAGQKQAYAAYLSAKSNASKLSSTSISTSLEAANSNVDAAAESVQIAEDNLEKAELKAPIDGVVIFDTISASSASALTGSTGSASVSSGKATEGAAVSPAAPVFTVVQLGGLRFNADVDEVDVPKLKKGMTARITLDAFPGETFESKVTRIGVQAVQTATGGTVFPVYVSLTDTGKRILIGMKGDAAIETSALSGVLTVPVEAVLEDGDQSYVFVVQGDKAQRRNVKVGTLTETRAEILSGVNEGDEVVVSGSGNLKDGSTVRTK